MSIGQQKARTDSIRYAMAMGKRPHFANGGVVGPLLGTDGGRTDTLPISVPAGAYVVPSDVVSGLPGAEGNSLAGHNALNKLFASAPFAPDNAPYGASSPTLGRGQTIPRLRHEEHELSRAKGGAAGDDHPIGNIDIMAAGGEHVIGPDTVRAIGKGDLKRGHEILDLFVKEVRKKNIKTLSKLPGPVKHD